MRPSLVNIPPHSPIIPRLFFFILAYPIGAYKSFSVLSLTTIEDPDRSWGQRFVCNAIAKES